ncbi:MAG: Tex family protein, partial [Caulobacterales bacterium]
EAAKFADYFKFDEPIKEMPSHRALALLRGEKEGVLKIDLDLPHDEQKPHPAIGMIMSEFGMADKGRPSDSWLAETARLAWKSRLAYSSASDLIARLKERSDSDAIQVFSKNLKALLLAAPAGPKVVMGIDPGIRTGCKVAVVDATGKVLETATIYPHEPKKDWAGSLVKLFELSKKYKVELVSVGNGTAGRETDKLVAELSEKMPDLKLTRVMVSEAGASVYSASELAAKEFPNLDVSIRGAVSIARRLQDPLAELVKIEPKAIGVGQYQHDVDQSALAKSLDATVEDCVNAVGVDVNTASAPLLARVAGLNLTIAENIVAYRDEHGPFKTRTALKKVPRMGPKTYEQAAGFLRIMDGPNPLDGSAVHPEAYPVVERIAEKTGKPLKSLIGDKQFLSTLKPAAFADKEFGIPTITDILSELEKPGRDPRPQFKTATFKDGIEKVSDLKPGMRLEGVVTNVTAFGAFVDVGVHQDGLVHISELSDTFVKDPHEVVKAGDVVKVLVREVDVARNRIGLSMKSNSDKSTRDPRAASQAPAAKTNRPAPQKEPASTSPFAQLSKMKVG